MQDAAIEILDRGLVIALSVFLLVFCAYVSGSFLSVRWRNRKLLERLRGRFLRDSPEKVPDLETRNVWRSYLQKWDGIRSGLWAIVWAAGVSCLVFLFACFSPWPSMKNFANLTTRPPLRVTFLMVDPSEESFRIEGDVWNQSEARLPVRASIILLDETGTQVGAATGSDTPLDLAPRDRGQFTITVAALPRATKFTLCFLGQGDRELAYSSGFPETRETIMSKGRADGRKRGGSGSR